VVAQGSGHYLLPAYPGLIVKKNSYWRWPERELARKTPIDSS